MGDFFRAIFATREDFSIFLGEKSRVIITRLNHE
jgi:hypothetical protein